MVFSTPRDKLDAIFEDMVTDLTIYLKTTRIPDCFVAYFIEVFLSNTRGGKLFRALAVTVFLGRPLSPHEFRKLSTLGWLVEMLPCWYRRPEVGLIAVNDACLLKTGIFILLRKCFRAHLAYLEMVEGFKEVAFATEMPDLGITTKRNIEQTKDILVPLGRFYQVQNDFLDAFGSSTETGNIGTDIQENKCTWVVINALSICERDRRSVIRENQGNVVRENYGKKDQAAARRVREVFESLPLMDLFEKEEGEFYGDLKRKIDRIDESERLRKGIFNVLLDAVPRVSK